MGFAVDINGFHGTKEDYARSICESKTFTYKNRDNHWLGQGIYFFRDDPEQAMKWALKGLKHGDKGVVIRTKISSDFSSFLDLNTQTGIERFQQHVEEVDSVVSKIESLQVKATIDGKQNNANHRMRCAVMDLLPPQIKIVQQYFEIENPPKKISENEFLRKMNIKPYSVQICVRDKEVIDQESIVIHEKKSREQKRKFHKTSSKKINYK
ncbi:hypothetical protein [Alkalicoccus urumqiensis]|uniref:DUF3990 domain-containing protein n=1 Tax=Alkalicoccus urumqiensis TaxID=1548213 RepID=A0A2P6ME47_ALKUR|nr:hypothetical protein [Alkalicoccus urumqiensis]PRO64558.1 hypothetical protein C6I21_13750 [Alkalicoccus urumqiensis]